MNYEPLIERDREAIAAAAHDYLRTHSADQLWLSVARFAVLAYAPSQHAKRAVLACRAARDLREDLGNRWVDMIIECARYASDARPPWSEPPILDPPEPSSGTMEELRAAMAAGDRVAGERWLSARMSDAEGGLAEVARGDARLMLEAAIALEPLLGDKGRYALLRMPLCEVIAEPDAVEEDASMETLIARAVEEKGAVDAVRAVLVACARKPVASGIRSASERVIEPYELARDYAQTLLAHACAKKLTEQQAAQLFEAVHHNLEHGESYAGWSFA